MIKDAVVEMFKTVFAGSFSDKEFTEKWEFDSPREQLKPLFYKGDGKIVIEGNGNPNVFGYWKFKVDVEGGKAYKYKVRFKTNGIEDLNLHVLNIINWRIKGMKPDECPYDQISNYYREGEYIIGEQSFETAKEVSEAEIQLGARYIKNGSVSWFEVSLTGTEREKSRAVIVTAVKWNSYESGTAGNNRRRIEDLLDQAGASKSDLVLLPEFTNQYSPKVRCEDIAESVPEGETCRLLAEKARQYKMNVCAGIVERDGDFLYNTAVLFDRKGEFSGKYRKVHLYWPEAMFCGLTPGDEHPVFDTDIGKIGIIICYDSWYPETSRILALKGAELILFPNAGYEPLLLPARAIDNGVYLAASSMYAEAVIVDTRGKVLARTDNGIVSTCIDLSKRPLPHPNAGGTMNSAPGGRRGIRNSKSGKLYEELLNEVKTWENRYEKYTWL